MTRSNRTLTQFAVDCFELFETDPGVMSETRGNTTISVHMDKHTQCLTFQVLLFDESIFEVDANHIMIRNGGFFDSKGRPTKTTRERLNGLLDAAGRLRLIPEGVRIFLGHNGQKETCFVGKGTTLGALDSQSPDRVIKRDNDQLLVF